MTHPETVAGVLQELRDVGVRLALDDFGQGHSSLARLQRFQVSTLKIDREFIPGVTQSPEQRALVAGIVAMSHALGLVVVAEGVETEEQLAIVRDLGCDLIQGFVFSRPIEAESMRAMLAAFATGVILQAA